MEVVIVSAEGTIALRHDRQADTLASSTCGEELLALPGVLAPDVPVSDENFSNIGSFGMDLDTLLRLATRLDAILARPDVAGVVVTHETNIIEEAVFLSDLVVALDKRVVFTGA